MGGWQMVKRVVTWTSNIFMIILLFICALTMYSIVQTKSNPEEIPTILGYKAMIVLTGSMEPVLEPRDLIVVKTIDPLKVKVNDVITYKNSQNTMVTHRVVDVKDAAGNIAYETKGDANNVKDEEIVQSDQLVGSLLFSIPKAGYLVTFFKSPTGIAVLIVLPFLLLSIGVLNRFFNNEEKQDGDIAV